jgi:hypothetical protein
MDNAEEKRGLLPPCEHPFGTAQKQAAQKAAIIVRPPRDQRGPRLHHPAAAAKIGCRPATPGPQTRTLLLASAELLIIRRPARNWQRPGARRTTGKIGGQPLACAHPRSVLGILFPQCRGDRGNKAPRH